MSLDERNAELEKKLEVNPIDEQIATLTAADSRRRGQVRLLAISLVLDLLLTIGFGFVTVRTNRLANQAENNRDSILRNCITANESRANNKKLWDYLFVQTASNPRTPQQAEAIAEFRDFVNETFAPRDCHSEISNPL